MKEKILELRKKGLTIDEIVKKLGCAKSTVSYHINNNGLGAKRITKKIIDEMNIFYLTHSLEETSKNFNVSISTITKYCENKRIKSNKTRKQIVAIAVTNRRKKVKKLAIEYKGSFCERCGYNKCDGALEFHHLDPNEKDFSISSSGNTRAWELIKKELDKCIMVCANCHREIHEEERNKKAS